MSETVRPTKKQRDILVFIEQFIAEHGYSPSYREIMNGLNYTSVATVSLHVNSLIRRGHLRKRDRSARSLEVVAPTASQGAAGAAGAASGTANDAAPQPAAGEVPDHSAWLASQITGRMKLLGQPGQPSQTEAVTRDIEVLIEALAILGHGEQAVALKQKLQALQTPVSRPARPSGGVPAEA